MVPLKSPQSYRKLDLATTQRINYKLSKFLEKINIKVDEILSIYSILIQ
jgi:hypothetical protein